MKRVAATIALTVLLAVPASAATLVNGSFDTGVPGDTKGLNNNQTFGTMPGVGDGWDRWASINGWTTISGAGIEIQTDRTLGDVAPQDGQYYVELDSNNNSAMKQDVWLARGKYLLSFWYSPRSKSGQNDAQLAGSNVIDYAIGSVAGSVTGPSEAYGTAIGRWTQVFASFTANEAKTYSLVFAANGTNNSYGGLLDNVTLDFVAPVPVPAAGLLLIGALGGLAAFGRRRKA